MAIDSSLPNCLTREQDKGRLEPNFIWAQCQMESDKDEFVVAFYVTGHGLGHATRVVEITRYLIELGHTVYIVTAAPEYAFTREIHSPKLRIRCETLDLGAIQTDPLTVDPIKSLEEYLKRFQTVREEILMRETSWLRSVGAVAVVADIPPLACKAAQMAGIPAVAVTNFSWDFIYADYLTAAGGKYQQLLWQISADYASSTLLIRLPGYVPMPAFRNVVDIPLVVRMARRSASEIREQYGIMPDEKVVLLCFGGQNSKELQLKADFLPQKWKCFVFVNLPDDADDSLPDNYIKPPRDEYLPDFLNASDAMLGKIGYGTTSEAIAHKKPLIYIRREFFNEEPFLRNMLELHSAGVEMPRRDFDEGNWTAYLQRAVRLRPKNCGPVNGGEVAAGIISKIGKGEYVHEQNAEVQLRDAIVYGYHLRAARSEREGQCDLEIPLWYTRGLSPLEQRDDGLSREEITHSPEERIHGFKLMEAVDYHLKSDTLSFLKLLQDLKLQAEQPGGISTDTSPALTPRLPEYQNHDRRAATGMFRWRDEITVARAPGRLDLMGGISDYSGATVLQLPLREACHVAIQRQKAPHAELWKHIQERHLRQGRPNIGVIRMVSLGADLSNRAPTFDMDVTELYEQISDHTVDSQQIITYSQAREFFARDPSRQWASYVAGCILVLMREKGLVLQTDEGLSILISSQVPEGKGVSSSASVEVASMMGLIRCFGLEDTVDGPREVALLAQKVENLVVGAPCGVMDQMASACGFQSQLLALRCQPAELMPTIALPDSLEVWGIDSGIRHSVGGADYGSVRVGTFMGRQMIFCKQKSPGSMSEPDHLVNLVKPNEFEELAVDLPINILGSEFLKRYATHNDEVTTINPDVKYAVRNPTRHPIYEHFRTKIFAQILQSKSPDFEMLGELMYQSHSSYSACGLGSDGTDRLVSLVRDCSKSSSGQTVLFGAKITGGGSGGTVAVLGLKSPEGHQAIQEVVRRYEYHTGYAPVVFRGSSNGAFAYRPFKVNYVGEEEEDFTLVA